jgi:hypothetical protein
LRIKRTGLTNTCMLVFSHNIPYPSSSAKSGKISLIVLIVGIAWYLPSR